MGIMVKALAIFLRSANSTFAPSGWFMHAWSHMLITRKRSNSLTPPPLSLGPSIIERTYSYKYLGVTISSNLSWSEHIHAICTKAKRLLGFLYRHFYSNANTSSLLKLYISLIRPHLEYACQVWHPHLLTDINKLAKLCFTALCI